MKNITEVHKDSRAWMTVLLISAAALIILIMCIAALQIAAIAGN